MFNVPVTYLVFLPDLERSQFRGQIYHEFASNGAKHLVFSETLARMALADELKLADFSREAALEGLDFVDAHAPFGELLDLNCPVPEFRPKMLEIQKRFLGMCATLGVHTATIHIGNNGHRTREEYYPLEYNRACVEDSLEKLLPVAEDAGVTICIENIWFQTNTPEELLRYKSLFPTDTLGFCYDAGHAHLMETHPEIPFEQRFIFENWNEHNHAQVHFDDHILEKMLPHIVNCHLHDNNGLSDQHLNIRKGTIHWEKIIPLLKKAPRLQCVQCEVLGVKGMVGVKDVVDQFNWLGTLE